MQDWWLIVIVFWFFGLLLGLTTCAITLMLIMSGICDGTDKPHTRIKSLALSFVYIFSLACAYAFAGVITIALGRYMHGYLQNNWIILSSISMLLILLGLYSLGNFNFKLSNHLLPVIRAHHRIHGYGSLSEVVYMGIIGTLIAAPCILAPLVGILAYIANTGNLEFGAVALFFTGIGFGTPLIATHISGSKALQMAGAWQAIIKQFFGLMLLGLAIWFLGRIIPAKVIMFLWAALVIFTAVYTGALIKDEKDSSSGMAAVCSLDGEEVPQKDIPARNVVAFSRMITFMILLYGFIILVGALLGNENPFAPLEHPVYSKGNVAHFKIV